MDRDKFVTRFSKKNRRSRSSSGDSTASTSSSLSFGSSTPISPEQSERSRRAGHMHFYAPEILIMKDEMTMETRKAGVLSHEGSENEEAIKELKSHLETLESFYVFNKFVRTEEKMDGKYHRRIHTGIAMCQHPRCKGKKGFTYSTHTRSHLKQHYKSVHKDQLPQLCAAIDGLNNKRSRSRSHISQLYTGSSGPLLNSSHHFCSDGGLQTNPYTVGENASWSRNSDDSIRKKRPIDWEESFKEKFNQKRARHYYTRWFIETMMPLAVADHSSTERMFYLINPEFQPTSRRTLGRDIVKLMDRGRTHVFNILFHQKWVATTADSWVAHNRAFLGMTVHWIDRDTLKRRHATLACKEVKERPTHQLLGKLITEIHQDFSIDGKVTATTTDNGTNYVAAFNTFGEANQHQEDLPVDPENPDLEIMDLEVRLMEEGCNPSLPPHHRCSTHTVNLLATTDVKDVQSWWRPTTAKIQALWSLQNRSPVAANQIKKAAKRKLKTPVATRWNSLYDCVVVLLEVLSVDDQLKAINTILNNHSQPKGESVIISEVDIQVLREYKVVMQPVVQCLDMLQGKRKAYMGTLLPILWLMKASLEKQSQKGQLLYAKPLVQALLRGYKKRFAHLFEDGDLLMATALHPNFTPKALESIAPDVVEEIKDMIISELMTVIRPREEQQQRQPAQPEVQERQDLDACLFNMLFSKNLANQQQDVREVLRKSMEEWMPSKGKLAWSVFPYQHREVWVELFIKYNTRLPSSAAVERLFSTAGDVLKAKSFSLDEVNFEDLVFLKGNMDLLEENLDQEDMEEDMEEEDDLSGL